MAKAEDVIQQQTGAACGSVTPGSAEDQGCRISLCLPQILQRSQVQCELSSVALNKWLKPQVPDGCVIHSFRHSLRDRLRAIECPADIIDAIGGWTTDGVGHQYGQGHRLAVTHGWMKIITPS